MSGLKAVTVQNFMKFMKITIIKLYYLKNILCLIFSNQMYHVLICKRHGRISLTVINRDRSFIRPSLTKFSFAKLNCNDSLYTEFYSTWTNNREHTAKFIVLRLFYTTMIFIKLVIAQWSSMENCVGFLSVCVEITKSQTATHLETYVLCECHRTDFHATQFSRAIAIRN